MSREIEHLLQKNEVLQERLDRKPLEVQDAIEQALANVNETNDREKNDLTRRVRELEGHADKVMMRQHSLTSRHDSELNIKNQDLAEALAQVKALKHEIVVLKRENTAICTEINRQVHWGCLFCIEQKRESARAVLHLFCELLAKELRLMLRIWIRHKQQTTASVEYEMSITRR